MKKENIHPRLFQIFLHTEVLSL